MAVSLERSRGSLKQRLTNLRKYIDNLQTNSNQPIPNLAEIRVKLTNYERVFDEFQNVQIQLECSCADEDLENHYNYREEFENSYDYCIGFLKQYLTDNSPHSSVGIHSQNTHFQDSLNNILIPKMKINTFRGESEHWLEFKTTFLSVVHSSSIPNIHKFQILRQSVDGYAKRIVDQVEFAGDFYDTAWKTLCDRFDNKKVLINKHIKNIFSVEQIFKESPKHLRQMLDTVSDSMTSIDGLKVSKDNLCDLLLIHVISNKLDKSSYRDWKEFNTANELPTLNEFFNFLKHKIDTLDEIHDQNSHSNQNSKNNPRFSNQGYSNKEIKKNFLVSSISKRSCKFCKKENHSIYSCIEFLKLDIQKRIQKIKELQLCENCLRSGHNTNDCTLRPCIKCNAKHNSLLHLNKYEPLQNNNETNHVNFVSDTPSDTSSPSKVYLTNNIKLPKRQVLLSTVVFNVKNCHGKLVPCRALLDSGAQTNLITERFCKENNIHLMNTQISIMGINQVVSHLNKKCNITIFSRHNNFNVPLTFFVVPYISNDTPTSSIQINDLNIPADITLADPTFNEPSNIDAIIGASLFWDLLTEGKIKLGKGMPILQNTYLGWVISGNIHNDIVLNSVCNFARIVPEDEQLKRFWEIENIQSKVIMSKDDLECEKQFHEQTYRNVYGQFTVKYPLKFSVDHLGNSYEIALKRFINLERKFKTNEKLKIQYQSFMKEYSDLGHMSQTTLSNAKYFLPHHGVIKEDSLTTKLRVVFDGSCQTDNGWSLNDIQFCGPKIQNDIFQILVRFRIYKYVVSSDITKMYRQILIDPSHRPLQCILWRSSENDEINIYQLNTVTYGTTSAPYLAINCLRQLGFDTSIPKEVSRIILEDFYVDDLLTGSNNLDELKENVKIIFNHLSSANFTLRKWLSNDIEVLSLLNIDQRNPLNILPLGINESSKTLGIQWYSHADILKIQIPQQSQFTPSKRRILSEIAQIYDPLGLVSPIIISAKIFIQHLWSLQISWDDQISSESLVEWEKIHKQIISLNKIEIPRNTVGKEFSIIDLHCFSDASCDAYASCIYVRSQNSQSKKRVRLLCSKTKVAPIKTLSIPRLELCAALLGTQLTQIVLESLNIKVPVFFWSDSQVVLHWLKTEPNILETFVANRVSKIQLLTDNYTWNYVRSNNNPADIASRGISTKQLLECNLWWNGPEFLLNTDPSHWSNLFLPEYQLNEYEIPGLKKLKVALNIEINPNFIVDLVTRYSNFHKFKRVFAYCQRFIKNIKDKSKKEKGLLQVTEIESAFTLLIKIIQKQTFPEDYSKLSCKQKIEKKSKLFYLNPFIDINGIIHVGGRLRFTGLPETVKQPILLPKNHPLTLLIFNHYHNYLHPGPQLLLSLVRQRYWPISGKIIAKQVVRKCITCFRHNPPETQIPIGPLPNERITKSFPFQHVGLDYAGPFDLLDRKGRGAKIRKCYICVFVCFLTKGVHLELITDMTTDCFLACFKRFISRRGIPSHVYSDNGATFKGAYNDLRDLSVLLESNQSSINDYALTLNITWKFTPPYSPNFGGLWEAAVKQMKHHLKRTMKNIHLTYEEFLTLLNQIEAILNSRPLYAMSTDPTDFEPLTPSHFLIHRNITSIPHPDISAIPFNRLTRYKHIQQLYQRFWKRFSSEYITQLHQSYKWNKASNYIQEGSLVLIKETNLPPCKWRLGRIIKTFISKDSNRRVAEVRTTSGTVTRSARLLHPLPIENDSNPEKV